MDEVTSPDEMVPANEHNREEIMALVAKYRARGRLSARAIARKLQTDHQYKVSHMLVHRYLTAMRKHWRETHQAETEYATGEILSELRELRSEAWLQLQRSAEDTEELMDRMEGTSTSGGEEKAKPKKVTREKRVKRQVGSAHWASVIADLIRQEREILGVTSPSKLDVTTMGEKVGVAVVPATIDPAGWAAAAVKYQAELKSVAAGE